MRQILGVGKGFVAISGRCRYKSRRNKEKDLETVENRPNFAASNDNNNNLKMNNMKQFISSFIAATLIISGNQEAIDKFGYDNCFEVTEVPTSIWDNAGMNSISPNVDRNDLCLVRCLNYSYAINGYAPHVGGLICNRRIGNELVEIFRELYEAKYVIVQTDALQARSKSGLQGCTYAYYYNQEEAETIPMAQQQGLAVIVNGGKPLNTNDIAVRLFKDKGFTWGGDEPNGNPNYFSK